MFKLAERRGHSNGPYCGPEGLYVGSSPLIAKLDGSYRVRETDRIAVLIAAAYGPQADAARLLPGLRLVAAALQQGDIARAMIAAVHLQLGEMPEDRLARLAQAEALLKDNFASDEPRVPAGNPDGGQWTTQGGPEASNGDDDSAESEGSSSSGAQTITGLASWYDLVGRRMANGRLFDPKAMNAAMLKVPLGTVVNVHLAEDPSRSIAVTVTDRGPYKAGRVIDLTKAAFKALVGRTDVGLVKVIVTIPRAER